MLQETNFVKDEKHSKNVKDESNMVSFGRTQGNLVGGSICGIALGVPTSISQCSSVMKHI